MGIRQGCPLSPYLFVVFLSVLMHDVKQELAVRFPQINIHNPYHVHSSNMQLIDMIYADDILLYSRSTVVLQEFLTTLQKHAAFYNMRLNLDKTTLLHMNVTTPIPVYFYTPDHPNMQEVKTAN